MQLLAPAISRAIVVVNTTASKREHMGLTLRRLAATLVYLPELAFREQLCCRIFSAFHHLTLRFERHHRLRHRLQIGALCLVQRNALRYRLVALQVRLVRTVLNKIVILSLGIRDQLHLRP